MKAVLGSVLLIVGLALLVLPGPGIPLIVAGLALLATRFAWAKRLHEQVHVRFHAAVERLRVRAKKPAGAGPSSPP